MNKKVRILILEDNPNDAELNERELRKAGISFVAKRVETREAFLKELMDFMPDIVLSDYGLPQFNGLEALHLFRESKFDKPFILVTGSLTEEVAVECMRAGADDYILKTSLKRLPSAVWNALEKVETKRAKKEATEALRHSEEKYRSVVNNLKEVVFKTDANGKWMFLNPAWTEITGFTVEESIGQNFLNFVHPEDRQRNLELFEMLVERRKDYCRHEIRYMRKDGGFCSVEVHARLTLDAHDSIMGTSGTLNDITEHKRIEAERDSERQLLNALVEQLPVGVLFRDTQGRYMRANLMASQILGIERHRLARIPADELLRLILATGPDGEPVKVEDIPSSIAVRSQRPSDPVEWTITTPAGEMRRVVISAAPVALQGEEHPGSVIVIADVTEQHLVQEQLRQSQKMEAVGQLAGGVAHDFNNLLTVINGYSDMLLRSFDEDSPFRHKTLEIKKAAERAASLTRQLLAFSRKQVLQPKVLDLSTIITDIDKMLRRLIGEDIDLRTVIEPALWQVKADPGQIEQVLMNLVINARDAMPGGGKVTVKLSNVHLDENYAGRHTTVRPGPYVMLAVSDTGCGMDAETQKRIFEPFFTTKELGKGTGMGLSTVYGIVKQSGGSIWVYSEVGRGTTFKIYLPKTEETTKYQESSAASAKLPEAVETILLVEDEKIVRKLVQGILMAEGYHVLAAESGSEALEINRRYEKPIDLILTDVVMPQMGGREVAERITLFRPGVKVLYMSGYTDESIVHHGVLDEGVAFLEKPFTADTLTRKVREVLDGTPSSSMAYSGDIEADKGKDVSEMAHAIDAYT